MHLGDLIDGGTHDFMFTTVDGAGVPTVLTGSPALSVYKDNSITETLTGPTLTASFDGRVGMNHVRLVLTDAFYVADTDYTVVITTGTVDGNSVVGYVVATFSISNRMPNVNVAQWLDTVPAALVGTRVDASVGAMAANVVTATAINTAAITAAKFGAGAIDNAAFNVTETLTANPATGGIVAASFGAGAINAAAIAADALTAIENEVWDALKSAHVVANSFGDFLDIEVSSRSTFAAGGNVNVASMDANSIAAGTIAAGELTNIENEVWDALKSAHVVANSFGDFLDTEVSGVSAGGGELVASTTTSVGTTTTCVDTARTEIDDTWIGALIVFTSGVEANRCRLITEFVAATDTITFAPPVSAAVAGSVTYEIHRHAGADVQSWLGTEAALAAPNALVGGAVDADVSAIQAGAIDAASIAAAAMNGKGDWNIGKTGYTLTQAFPSNFSDLSIAITTGLVDITQAAADKAWSTGTRVLTANTNLNDPTAAVIADAVLNEDMTAHQTLGSLGQAIGDPVANTKTLYAALVTDAAGASVTADVATVQGDTDNIQTRLPAALVGGAMNADVSALQAAALTAIENEVWDALKSAHVVANSFGDFLDIEVSGRATPAQVLTNVNTALDTTIAELGVAAPAVTPTLRTGLMLLYMALRNKLDVQTSGTDALELHNDAGTQITSKLLTDATGDYSEAKMT